eukprot:261869-Prymnesium_polylepis.1
MSGLERFVTLDKQAQFVGKEAATRVVRDAAAPPARRLVTLEVHGGGSSDAHGYEPVWVDGKTECVGFTTSGGFGHTVGKSLAMAYVDSDALDAGKQLSVHLLGERVPATFLGEPAYDPTGERMFGADPTFDATAEQMVAQ